ncbi:MAG TPA: glycosyltransferase [Nitrososphaerales archaeon]|nr:glycosyltransferase [Nitrososphaerales archaeon]
MVVSIPVFAYSAYSVVLLMGSLSYKPLTLANVSKVDLPKLSVLMATYNEENVVGETLDSIGRLDYPSEKLQVIIADDSHDGTVRIVDERASYLGAKGIEMVVSRRGDRTGFKAGALNLASNRIKGDVVLLLDADSRVTSSALNRAFDMLIGGGFSFVSFRVGHYNRELNLVTRAFALFQDTIDGLQKMGSTRLGLPYSLQGGFALVRTEALREAGFWREGVLAEDADLSCRLFASGSRGAYVSEAELVSEDPSTLRIWKRQAARVGQGWAQSLRLDFSVIARSRRLGLSGKIGLLLVLLSPFAGLTWILVTLLSAIAILTGIIDPGASAFGNPLYVALVSIPVVVFYVSGVYALRIRRMLSARNLLLLPVLSYMISAMFTISAISFVSGLAGTKAEFFRTPKRGATGALTQDRQPREGSGVRVAEGGLSLLAAVLSVPMFLRGQYLLGLSLLGFGLVTLKSMELFDGSNSTKG